MLLKDHYKTLGVSSNASSTDIKKAYRSLAHKYHPDKAQENPFAASLFRDIQEAYTVLSDERKRKLYDEERYYAGLAAQKEPQRITGEWILNQAGKLSAHVANVDSYRMNHGALYEYVLLLLSDNHLAILKQERQKEVDKQIIVTILSAIKLLQYSYFSSVCARLQVLADNQEDLSEAIRSADRTRKTAATASNALPYIIILVAIIMCIVMYCYSRRLL